MTSPGEWGPEWDFEVTAELIGRYAAVVDEEPRPFGNGAPAPPMFAVVYAAPAIWETVVATVDRSRPLIHAAQEFEWFAAVHAGDRIATRARLERESATGAHPALCFRSVSRRGEELVSRGVWTILMPEGGL
jgi:N-terminal half of MaoC dehydratase